MKFPENGVPYNKSWFSENRANANLHQETVNFPIIFTAAGSSSNMTSIKEAPVLNLGQYINYPD
ncbi:hypothetical protein B7P43_G02899 [Cryptotermes secundus]|uniref:Uncharacterized protein n=1 Tax=Cryptotermes secundus TaxID=105785 RepID=A0A2J7QG14_9NEOP|nr:hypothetical protein B7P43_G02899 [Cryptotermes secundus]